MSIKCAGLSFMHDHTESNDEDQFLIQNADPPGTPRDTEYSKPFQFLEKNRSRLRVHHLDDGTPETDPPSTPDGCWMPQYKCSDDTYLTFKQAMHQFSIPEKRRWIYSEKEKDSGIPIPLQSVSLWGGAPPNTPGTKLEGHATPMPTLISDAVWRFHSRD